jgi:HAD superfamily hydrolase (TIGR01484 family)
MRYLALATDFDGTLAHDALVPPALLRKLDRLRESGRRLILVTGRLLDDLVAALASLSIFDAIVAENGALVYEPASKRETAVAPPHSRELVSELTIRGVRPLEVGRSIVATRTPHENDVLAAIRDLGLELHVIFNKGAVMVLPSGINKATGLDTALRILGLSARNVAGVGDAENDIAFLQACECGAAVANALDSVKEAADVVLDGARGEGVAQLVDLILESDLRGYAPARRQVALATDDEMPVMFDPYLDGGWLVYGTSGSGKSKVVFGLVERLVEAGYQLLVVDPEGDYEAFGSAVVTGDAQRAPSIDEVERLLSNPTQTVVANLLGIPIDDRPDFGRELLGRLEPIRARSGRPHWIVLDEAHHVVPRGVMPASLLTSAPFNIMYLTVDPEHLAEPIGPTIARTIVTGENALGPGKGLEKGFFALRERDGEARVLRRIAPQTERRRHRRKYASGELAPEKSFYFRGPQGRLNLRAANLAIFTTIALGVDDETWLYHLRRRDISRWFKDAIGDEDLADATAAVESKSAGESRRAIVGEIEKRYTAPE